MSVSTKQMLETLVSNANYTFADSFGNSDQCSTIQAYLESAVMGTLTEGLEDLCRQRPANPVDHLALFLLRRSKSSTVIEVPAKDAIPVQTTKTQ